MNSILQKDMEDIFSRNNSWEHRSLSGEFTDAGDYSILRTILIQQIVVGAGSNCTGKGSA